MEMPSCNHSWLGHCSLEIKLAFRPSALCGGWEVGKVQHLQFLLDLSSVLTLRLLRCYEMLVNLSTLPKTLWPGIVAHTCNSTTWNIKATGW